MMDDLQTLAAYLRGAIDQAEDLATLDNVRVAIFGKQGTLTQKMKELGRLEGDARKHAGQALNRLKEMLMHAFESKKTALSDIAMADKLARERVDVTLPVPTGLKGRLHPITKTLELMVSIFGHMGFHIADGPDIETDFFNFTALNFPMDHPARQTHDTFFLNHQDGDYPLLLRTHTSPVQIRALLAGGLPIKIIAPGRTYRCDSDQTHTPMFHQLEGLYIDRHVHMGHLKGCIETFFRAFFSNEDVSLRFRPSFFPFTEPSAEVDVGCQFDESGLEIGIGSDWLEVMGCGMVHPNVLRNCGIDPQEYQGFAFGMGIERLAMLRYGISDLRTMYESDVRWLASRGFVPLDWPLRERA